MENVEDLNKWVLFLGVKKKNSVWFLNKAVFYQKRKKFIEEVGLIPV